MAKHGRPRVTPEEVSKIVQKKDDVVANSMICFIFGREPLQLSLAPYFREIELAPTSKNTPQSKRSRTWKIIGAGVSGFFSVASLWNVVWPNSETEGDEVTNFIIGLVLAVVCYLLVQNLRQAPSFGSASDISFSDVERHLAAGDEINAIKAYRAIKNCSLVEAQKAIESLKAER